jgi:hypothetical protein
MKLRYERVMKKAYPSLLLMIVDPHETCEIVEVAEDQLFNIEKRRRLFFI